MAWSGSPESKDVPLKLYGIVNYNPREYNFTVFCRGPPENATSYLKDTANSSLKEDFETFYKWHI